jgi:hypothetical protein
MRNKILTICCSFALCFAFSVKTTAQNNFAETVIVDLQNNSGAVSFQPQMSALQANARTPLFSSVNLKQQVINSEDGFQRILFDEINRVLFGYALKIKRNAIDSKFEISFEPLTESALNALNNKVVLAIPNSKTAFRLLTLPPISPTQTLADGETVALDLLVNSQMGVKITDRVRVAAKRETLKELPGKDFTLKDLHLAARASRLKINDKTFAVGNKTRRYDGSLLWFHVPEKGLFVVSLEPREGYDFRRIGFLSGNKVSFQLGSDEYEWTSSEAFLPIEGAWRLWVLHVPNYTPAAVALVLPVKPNETFEQSRIGKASDQLMETLRNNNPLDLDMRSKSGSIEAAKLRKKSDSPNDNPPRIAAGGAGSLDNLLPKN